MTGTRSIRVLWTSVALLFAVSGWQLFRAATDRTKVDQRALYEVFRARASFEHGLRKGDVVISINGIPVETRERAWRIGTRLWRNGERSWEIEFLSRGRRAVRTYYLPRL